MNGLVFEVLSTELAIFLKNIGDTSPMTTEERLEIAQTIIKKVIKTYKEAPAMEQYIAPDFYNLW